MHTPFFLPWRARLSAMGHRVQTLRRQSLCHLDLLFQSFLPADLLAQADEGPNSRERIFTVRRTFFGFLYQVLNPACSCREVVRQIQALLALHGPVRVDESTKGYSSHVHNTRINDPAAVALKPSNRGIYHCAGKWWTKFLSNCKSGRAMPSPPFLTHYERDHV